MSRVLRVCAPGAFTLVQDLGFENSRPQGLPKAGVLDRAALAQVNALVGNPAGVEALEVRLTGPTLLAHGGPARVGLSGTLSATLRPAEGDPRPVDPWTAVTLQDGDALAVAAPQRGGLGVVAIHGGLDLPRVMGSRSTFVRAGFGGFQGRALQAGDALPLAGAPPPPQPDARLLAPWTPEAGPIRVVLGPQREWFEDRAIRTFLSTPYTATRDMDRMGIRFVGERLRHRPEKGAEIISDGAAPGAIQAPGNGLPIALQADAQTIGGYPKIATVVSADLPKLAALVPGDAVTFAAVSVAEAERAARDRHAALQGACASLGGAHRRGEIDLEALYTCNLLSGVVDMSHADGVDGQPSFDDGASGRGKTPWS